MTLFAPLMTTEELSFENFAHHQAIYEGQEVKMRGFLYQLPNGQWALAQQPNLRSCCVHKNAYLLLDGDPPFVETTSAITVEGILHNDRIAVTKIRTQEFSFWTIGLLIIIVSATGIQFYVRNR